MSEFKHPREINKLSDPVVCCGRCHKPVFEVPTPVNLQEKILDTLLRDGKPIPPQPQLQHGEKAKCVHCGAVWISGAFGPTFLVAEKEKVVVKMFESLGKDAPIVTNERGGRQSHLPFRFDLLDPNAMAALGMVLYKGAQKHGEENWRNISIRDHLNHLLAHVFAYMAGDESDDHLEHAFCRAMMAVALKLEGKQYGG